MFRRRSVRGITATGALACLVLAGCGRSPESRDADRADRPAKNLVATTAPGTKDPGPLVWATYRDVQTLDPAFAFDYPDNTAVTLMCESLLRIQPDGQIAAGLATLRRPDPTTLVFDIKPQAEFWNGRPVTADDAVYSLRRQADPELGGFYSAPFSRVDTITATGDRQVTIKLKQPDYWLDGELASLAGIVVEKQYAENAGKDYGTPSGGAMCTGAYRFKEWKPATGVVATANRDYWDTSVEPHVSEITLKGVPDQSTLTSSLLTGAVSGSYIPALATLRQLEQSDQVEVYEGPGYNTDALVISSLKGALGDVRVRQALSLAVNRQGIIDSVHQGAAQIPRWFSNEGTFGYAKATFEEAYRKAPPMTRDLAKAKQLIADAGAAGKTITIGMSSEVPDVNAAAIAYQAAGKAIGLDVRFKAVPANDFINFFTDPKARADIDAFPTVNYGDYADPAALLATVVLPDGSQNFSGFADRQITDWMQQARGTADPKARAELIVKVQRRVGDLLPWIPTVQPTTVLVMNKNLTGAVSSFAYMFAPWANRLGGR